MDITILIERDGVRSYTSVSSQATGIEGVNRIRWAGEARSKNYVPYYSLVHVFTGRSLNRVPLSEKDALSLIEALKECPVEFEKIVDSSTARRYYVQCLTPEAARLAG
jgi:hypothetical protein